MGKGHKGESNVQTHTRSQTIMHIFFITIFNDVPNLILVKSYIKQQLASATKFALPLFMTRLDLSCHGINMELTSIASNM